MTHSLLPRLLSVLCLLATLAASLPAASPARATGAQAGTWYVATTGDDSNDCATPATPCATINAAIGKAADGDTIKVATGTYFDGLAIAKDITFLGGWNTAFSTQSSFSTIDGQQTRRPVYIDAEATVRLEQFHILNGDPGDWATGGGYRIRDKQPCIKACWRAIEVTWAAARSIIFLVSLPSHRAP